MQGGRAGRGGGRDQSANGFDEIAVFLRSPTEYLGLLENAFDRAGISAWFGETMEDTTLFDISGAPR